MGHAWLDQIVARADRYSRKHPNAYGSNASQAARDRSQLVAWMRIAGFVPESKSGKRRRASRAPREG